MIDDRKIPFDDKGEPASVTPYGREMWRAFAENFPELPQTWDGMWWRNKAMEAMNGD